MRVYSLASGSSGNCTYIESGKAKILVDAGISCKRITQSLEGIGVDPKEVSALFITHEHADHVKGVRTLTKKYQMPVYTREKTWAAIEKEIGEFATIQPNLDLTACDIEGVKIETFSVSHDAADPIGLCVHGKKETVGMATDTGYVTPGMKKHLTGADFLFMEANHDLDLLRKGNYPWHLKRRILSNEGHLSNVDSGMGLTALVSGKTKKVALAHLSEDNNTPALARQTVARILDEVRIRVDIDIASRHIGKELFFEEEE